MYVFFSGKTPSHSLNEPPAAIYTVSVSFTSAVLACVIMPASALADAAGRAVTVINSWEKEDETANSSASRCLIPGPGAYLNNTD